MKSRKKGRREKGEVLEAGECWLLGGGAKITWFSNGRRFSPFLLLCFHFLECSSFLFT